MTDKVFLDTNLWIYAYAKRPVEKHQTVKNLINQPSNQIQISARVLGEIFNVLTKKKFTSQADAASIVAELINDFPVFEITSSSVTQAIEISQRYGYTYWDSLILATALLNDCAIVYSEDMQHNQLIDSQLRLLNPFL